MNPAYYGDKITKDGSVSLSTDGTSLVIVVDNGGDENLSVILTRDEALGLMTAIKVWSEIKFEKLSIHKS